MGGWKIVLQQNLLGSFIQFSKEKKKKKKVVTEAEVSNRVHFF